MRIIGPGSIGVVNTDPAIALRATADRRPSLRAGRVGVFAQSAALSAAVLEAACEAGLGVSTFVSAGDKADVSGNDMLQYWVDDPATGAVLLGIESLGNPDKFRRLAAQLSRTKPIVAFAPGFEDVLRACGVTPAGSVQELIQAGRALGP